MKLILGMQLDEGQDNKYRARTIKRQFPESKVPT